MIIYALVFYISNMPEVVEQSSPEQVPLKKREGNFFWKPWLVGG